MEVIGELRNRDSVKGGCPGIWRPGGEKGSFRDFGL